MQELYKSFEEQSYVLEDHHTQKTAAIKVFEDVIGWKAHIRDRPNNMPILDKLKDKKTKVTIETWEGICDAVDIIIQNGQVACKHRWTTSYVLLDLLGVPMLEPIKQAPSPKLKLK